MTILSQITTASMKKTQRMAPWVRLVRETSYQDVPSVKIRNSQDVVDCIQPRLAAEEVEVFLLLALDSQSRVRAVVEVTRGILNASLVHPREVFRHAIALGAAGIIVAHNHPSGDPTPSHDDRAVTRQLVSAGELLDIPVYDHVIVAGSKFTSVANSGLL